MRDKGPKLVAVRNREGYRNMFYLYTLEVTAKQQKILLLTEKKRTNKGRHTHQKKASRVFFASAFK